MLPPFFMYDSHHTPHQVHRKTLNCKINASNAKATDSMQKRKSIYPDTITGVCPVQPTVVRCTARGGIRKQFPARLSPNGSSLCFPAVATCSGLSFSFGLIFTQDECFVKRRSKFFRRFCLVKGMVSCYD